MAGFDSLEKHFLRAYEDLAAKADGLDAFEGGQCKHVRVACSPRRIHSSY